MNRASRSPSPVSHARATRSRGVGLAELLIALAISAMLLTATAVALDASFRAYRINQEQSSLIQRARLAIHRITTTIRQCEAHAPATSALLDDFATGQNVTDTGIAMYNDAGDLVRFSYDSVTQRLSMTQGGTTRTLVEGVTQFQVVLEPMRSSTSVRTGGVYDLLSRATLLLTVRNSSDTASSTESTGQQDITVSTSVMPRRNIW